MKWYWWILIYIAGAIVWYFIERWLLPYQEYDYTIDFDGYHELTKEDQRDNRLGRCVVWPLAASIVLALLPYALVTYLFEKFDL